MKCLGVLLLQVREDSIYNISDKLITLILTGTAELLDIYSIGLKKLIQSVPDGAGIKVTPKLTPRLLGGIEQDDEVRRGEAILREAKWEWQMRGLGL